MARGDLGKAGLRAALALALAVWLLLRLGGGAPRTAPEERARPDVVPAGEARREARAVWLTEGPPRTGEAGVALDVATARAALGEAPGGVEPAAASAATGVVKASARAAEGPGDSLRSRRIRLGGRVADEAGRGIGGARIEVGSCTQEAWLGEKTMAADPKGGFEVHLEAPDDLLAVAVEVDEPGFALWQGGWADEFLEPIEITLVPGRPIRFQLIDADHGPVRDARVTGKAGAWQGSIGASDGDGRFRVSIPLSETAIEIDVCGMDYPVIARRIVWPASGDLDFGRIVVKEEIPPRGSERSER
jgi:hypothetical protein